MGDMEWLASIKAGDVVFIESRFGLEKFKVTKVTPKQLVVGEYCRFRRDDGSRIGGSIWDTKHLYPVTPELERQYAAARARVSLREMSWSKLSDDAVIEVLALVTRHFPKADKK